MMASSEASREGRRASSFALLIGRFLRGVFLGDAVSKEVALEVSG